MDRAINEKSVQLQYAAVCGYAHYLDNRAPEASLSAYVCTAIGSQWASSVSKATLFIMRSLGSEGWLFYASSSNTAACLS